MGQLREVHDFLARRIVEEGMIGDAVQPGLDGDWPAVWYQGHGGDNDEFESLILAGPEGPDFDAGTRERARFVVLNDPAHVFKLLGYLRWTVANHKPVDQPAERDGETVAVEACPIDGTECEPLLRMADMWKHHPEFKKDWHWEAPLLDLAKFFAEAEEG
ncbi:DUF6221 family protein [Streptomyces sp. NPDC002262]|uniref:DUF6221 family protein n=1 Tax=Streptomyces sp. NPDC002262 TaxID=3154414 RepID=UPI00332D65C2